MSWVPTLVPATTFYHPCAVLGQPFPIQRPVAYTKGKDSCSRESKKKEATIHLQPDILNDLNLENTKQEVKLENNNLNPNASRGGRGGGSKGPRRTGRQGGSGGNRGGREGMRKRHPNFAARNRKIGKGGPTGKGGLSGTRKRMPTVPRRPRDGGDEPEDYYQEVDPMTGRTKRKQRPKSDEAKEKARKRKEEDTFRKSFKKKRPGPKAKDKKDMKEKIKRFWRETPKPKGKKVPKFIGDGLESEKEQSISEPEDFDDLRMPSKEQIRKLEKAKRKEIQRKQKKHERKQASKEFDEFTSNNLLQGREGKEVDEYVPTLSELEEMDGEVKSIINKAEADSNNELIYDTSPQLKSEIKPKKGQKLIKDEEDLDLESEQNEEYDYAAFLEQKEQFEKFSGVMETSQNNYHIDDTEVEEDNKIISREEDKAKTYLSSKWNEEDSYNSDFKKETDSVANEIAQDEKWSKYRKDVALKASKRSLLVPGIKIPRNKLHEMKDVAEDTRLADDISTGTLNEKDASNYLDGDSLNELDQEIDDPKIMQEFEKDYEDIKEYLMKKSASNDESERESKDGKNDDSGSELESASDEDEVWDRNQKRFRKQLRKKRKKTSVSTLYIDSEDHNINTDSQLTECGENALENMLENQYSQNGVVNRNKLGKKDRTVRDTPVSPLKPTGSIVDEKLDLLRSRIKKFPGKNNEEVPLDDVLQHFYNDDDPMVKFQEDISEEEWQDKSVAKKININDYDNYDVPLSGNKVSTDFGNASQSKENKDVHKRTNDDESESTDLSEDASSSDSYREEYDIALMAGLRSDRIRVFDRNVEMYADQDHQAKRFHANEYQGEKTLTDIEYERSKTKHLDGKKLCDDDILMLTENEEPKQRIKKSEKKRSEVNTTIVDEFDTINVDENSTINQTNVLEPELSNGNEIGNPEPNVSKEEDSLNLEVLHPFEIENRSQIKSEINITDPLTMSDDRVENTSLEAEESKIQDKTNGLGSSGEKEEAEPANEEEERTMETFQKEWDSYVTAMRDCVPNVDIESELPTAGSSAEEEEEEEEEEEGEDNRYNPNIKSFETENREEEKLTQDSKPVSTGEPVMEELPDNKGQTGVVQGRDAVSSNGLVETTVKLKKGINEYLEEDRWDLWYRFVALMNNNNTRSYDNCVALFKAKKQEILTRKKAPSPPWEEPGLDDYERKRRKVQREWEKTERDNALRNQKGFSEFLYETEGIPQYEYGPDLEDTYRFLFDMMNTKEYDHQAYKDSLSKEELAEIYSEGEVEEELRERELRKQGKDLVSTLKRAEESGDPTFNQVPPIDHMQNTFDELINLPNKEFSHYDTVPDWIKNDPTNPINYKTYSKKMGTDLEDSNSLPNTNENKDGYLDESNGKYNSLNNHNSDVNKDSQSIEAFHMNQSHNIKQSFQDLEKSVARTTTSYDEINDRKGQLSKAEQAQKMWQYFLHLMKERHEKNIEKFTSLSPSSKTFTEGEAKARWLQYAAFLSGDSPIKMPESAPSKQVEAQSRSGQESISDIPSVGWRKFIQRIEALRMDPTSKNHSAAQSQPTFPGQPPPSEGGYGDWPPYQNTASYNNAASTTWENYPQQHYREQYPYTQPYTDPASRPPPRRQDPYYGPPVNQAQRPGYEHQPQPRGLQGMNQYMQFASQRGDQYDPHGRPLPPNVSINRAYNGADMGFQNPYFVRAMDESAAYINNQSDPYTANRSRVGWPGDHSDKFHNRKYFMPDMGGQQTYIPRDFTGQPGDHSDRNYNRSNFRNPNLNYRGDTFSNQPFPRAPADPNNRSIRSWQSGTRPLASSGLQSGPSIPTGPSNQQENSFVTDKPSYADYSGVPKTDSSWPTGPFERKSEHVESSQPNFHVELPAENSSVDPTSEEDF
ncbi:uncharacterized protein LOC128995593 [Macrosteles quadrilineatus]|uniref:uncharacterized protein LOC128995593 n=1 Tax=Macrosteles quadrilineatus TaxID=74068 RepID=UPI0023E097B3|nr:uncharacterized protein LOC128995593 [Macrosteles quadrilineatus]